MGAAGTKRSIFRHLDFNVTGSGLITDAGGVIGGEQLGIDQTYRDLCPSYSRGRHRSGYRRRVLVQPRRSAMRFGLRFRYPGCLPGEVDGRWLFDGALG